MGKNNVACRKCLLQKCHNGDKVTKKEHLSDNCLASLYFTEYIDNSNMTPCVRASEPYIRLDQHHSHPSRGGH